MSDYVGPIQVDILHKIINEKLPLYQEAGRWYFVDEGKRRYQNQERCRALYARGFLMSTGIDDSYTKADRYTYTATRKAQKA
jgi:hypothetical protein